jgi:pyrroline-5-carboxylate reductase
MCARLKPTDMRSTHDQIMTARIGFVGTGTIAEAMVEGFLSRRKDDLSILLSPRGAVVAQRLTTRYPQTVRLAESNQEVVDGSATIILAVRPQLLREVLSRLVFRPDHRVISVVAGFSRADVLDFVAPCRQATLAIPLPAMARGDAPTVLLPPDVSAAALFRRAGSVIEVEDERAYAALGTSTTIMASYFALAKTVTTWLTNEDVPEAKARTYVADLLRGLSETTGIKANDDFQALEEYHATPGSLNDALRTHLEEMGVFTAVSAGLDRLMKRMTGKAP